MTPLRILQPAARLACANASSLSALDHRMPLAQAAYHRDDVVQPPRRHPGKEQNPRRCRTQAPASLRVRIRTIDTT